MDHRSKRSRGTRLFVHKVGAAHCPVKEHVSDASRKCHPLKHEPLGTAVGDMERAIRTNSSLLKRGPETVTKESLCSHQRSRLPMLTPKSSKCAVIPERSFTGIPYFRGS